jgi:pimeloyl-ACP methyl ester carboxylesterase
MEELADWAARFLDAQGIARAHVAGNSMGGQVALALARRHPTRVGGLVLAGPTMGRHLIPAWS